MKADSVWGDDEEAAALDAQISSLDSAQLNNRTRMLENNVKVMRSELNRLAHEVKAQQVGHHTSTPSTPSTPQHCSPLFSSVTSPSPPSLPYHASARY